MARKFSIYNIYKGILLRIKVAQSYGIYPD